MHHLDRVLVRLRSLGHLDAATALHGRASLQGLCQVRVLSKREFIVTVGDVPLHSANAQHVAHLAKFLSRGVAIPKPLVSSGDGSMEQAWASLLDALKQIGETAAADKLGKNPTVQAQCRPVWITGNLYVKVRFRTFATDSPKSLRELATFLLNESPPVLAKPAPPKASPPNPAPPKLMPKIPRQPSEAVAMRVRDAIITQHPQIVRGKWATLSALCARIRRTLLKDELLPLLKASAIAIPPSPLDLEAVWGRVLQVCDTGPEILALLDEAERMEEADVLPLLLPSLVGDGSPLPVDEEPALQLLYRLRVLPNPSSKSYRPNLCWLACNLLERAAERLPVMASLYQRIFQHRRLQGADPAAMLEPLRRFAEGSKRTVTEQTIRRLTGISHDREESLPSEPSTLLPAKPSSPTPPAERTPVVKPDPWASLVSALGARDPGVPDEVMRSLLDATLNAARQQKRYGLPEVAYWVLVPDPWLQAAGIDGISFTWPGGAVPVRAATATRAVEFPLVIPPHEVRRGALYAILIAALTYYELVIRPERYEQTDRGLRPAVHAGGGRKTPQVSSHVRSPIRLARVRAPRGLQGARRAQPAKTASYVGPHLRHLRHGYPSDDALMAARAHGIEPPQHYTFVRGHVRGGAGMDDVVAYTLVDVALETIRRMRLRS